MSSKQLNLLRQDLKKYIRLDKKNILARFFKTGPGQYGEGDKFLGVMVPQIRLVSKKYINISWPDILELQKSPWHEERLCALLIMVSQYQGGNNQHRKMIYQHYLKSVKYINNWDLIDLTADRIVGQYLLDKDISILLKLAKSKNLWDRRIAILSTFAFIKKGSHQPTFRVAEALLNDDQDLIQKAVGWMLREVGKRCGQQVEEQFLNKYYQQMPRTMLRYAIERFPERLRLQYLKGLI